MLKLTACIAKYYYKYPTRVCDNKSKQEIGITYTTYMLQLKHQDVRCFELAASTWLPADRLTLKYDLQQNT